MYWGVKFIQKSRMYDNRTQRTGEETCKYIVHGSDNICEAIRYYLKVTCDALKNHCKS